MGRYLTILVIVCGTIGNAVAQDASVPGHIKLLPGYHHKHLQGIDTLVGEIAKKDGLSIKYDIGRLAGNYAAHQKKNGEVFGTKNRMFMGWQFNLHLPKTKPSI